MNGALPQWIQRMLGIEAGPGEGAAWRLLHTWPWAPWITLLLVVFAALFVLFVYSRESRRAGAVARIAMASIRAALIGIVLLMIAQFMLGVQRTGLPYLAVVIDDSASMTVVDHYEPRQADALAERLKAAGFDPPVASRENLAKMFLLERNSRRLRRFASEYQLRVYFVTAPRRCEAEEIDGLSESIRRRAAEGATTALGATLNQVLDDLRGTTPAGIVVLSDGINTEGPGLSEAAEAARRRGVPLFFVGLGDDRPVADLKLTDLLVDEVVFVDDVVYFEATLTASGYPDRELRVTLRREDEPELLAETQVTADRDGRPQRVRLAHRPDRVGQFRYVVEVEPREGETQVENNRLECTLDVRKEQIRVLLVQAYPSFEFRYLRNMLNRDATIRLHTLLQEADLEHASQDATSLTVFPVRRDELFGYDVVILGDVDFGRLGTAAMENLAAFVDRSAGSGALIFIAGPEHNPLALRDTPLEPMLPIVLGGVRLPESSALGDGFEVTPTPLGVDSPPMQLGGNASETKAVWEDLPPLYWMIEASESKPGARVLAVNPSRLGHDGRPLPVICLQYVGAGRVLMHMTDETWRWRREVGDRYFARYWVQMIRYLSRSKLTDDSRDAILSTDRREYRQGETVQFRLRFAGPTRAASDAEDFVVMVEQEGRRTRRVPLTRHPFHEMFEGTLAGVNAGKYHAWLADPAEGTPPTVDFVVAPPAGEFERTRMEASAMVEAAKRTRGRFYRFDGADRLAEHLPAGHHVPIETLPPVPLWNRWPVVLLFLGLLITEWIARKRKGLV